MSVYPYRPRIAVPVGLDRDLQAVLGEVDDLDLDTDAAGAVTVVEWGAGLADVLAEDRLEITIEPDRDGDARTVRINTHGARWNGALTGAADRL